MQGHEKNSKDFYRIFFSLLLDDTSKEALIKLIHNLKKSSLCHYVHWKKIEKLHITLHFIGNTTKEKIPLLIESVQKKIATLPTFNLEFMNLSAFPPTRHPHALVLNIKPSASLLKLVEEITHGVTEAELSGDKKSYIPHLTLGKLKKIPPATVLYPKTMLPNLSVKEVVLLKSVPIEGDTVYEVIEKLNLSN